MSEFGMDPNRLDDAVDMGVAEAGEHKVRCIRVSRQTSQRTGQDYFQAYIELADDPYTKDFTHYLGLPGEPGITPKQANLRKLAIRDFCQAFGVPTPSSIEDFEASFEDFEGLEAWAIIRVKDDENYGEQNSIKGWVKPA